MSDIGTLIAPVRVHFKIETRDTPKSPFQVEDKTHFDIFPGVYKSQTYAAKKGDDCELARVIFAVGRRAWLPEVNKAGREQEYRFGPKDSPVTVTYQRISDATVRISVGRK
jgi:hypothetical protein